MNSEFFARVAEVLGDRGLSDQKIKEIFSAKKFKAFRINKLLADETTFADQLYELQQNLSASLQPITWFEHAYLFLASDTEKITTSQLYKSGQIFIQNPSSFLPIMALDPKPQDKYLDTCSAPGGKAVLFAGLANNQADITLMDDNTQRVNQKLTEVLDHQGLYNARVINADAVEVLNNPASNGLLYDKILVDADCSSEGLINFLSKKPLLNWSLGKIKYFSSLQSQLLQSAYNHLEDNGRLVYSTCTLAPEENELVISNFLKTNPTAKLIKLEFVIEKTLPTLQSWNYQPIHPEVDKCLKINPDSTYMEAFFVCLITKSSNKLTVVKLG